MLAKERKAIPAGCVLFRVDAGPQIGLGHLRRCLALAAAMRSLGSTAVFVTSEHLQVKERLSASGFEGAPLGGSQPGDAADLQQTIDAATRLGSGVIVVDSYRVGFDYLRRLRVAGLFTVVIDDQARFPYSCRVVVNGGAHALELPYRSLSGDTVFLLGPRYVLLNPEFWDLPRRTRWESVRTVLVTLGGTDAHNLTPGILGMLETLPGDFSVTAVVGPFFHNRGEILRAAQSCRRTVQLIEKADSLRNLMVQADVAISAGGQTMYELAATGTPTAAVQVADNQAESLQAMGAKRVAQLAGRAGEEGLLRQLKHILLVLLKDREERAAMSAAMTALVDGRGALRAAEIILSAAGGESGRRQSDRSGRA